MECERTMRLYEEGEDRPEIELVREPRHYVYFAAKNGLVGHDAKGEMAFPDLGVHKSARK